MRAIAILFLAAVVCVLLVCAARLLGTGFAESQHQQFKHDLQREAAENIRKANEIRERESQPRKINFPHFRSGLIDLDNSGFKYTIAGKVVK